MRNILLIMMGGSGTRLGADIPKQYIELDGKPIFYPIVKAYAEIEEISEICIVSHPQWMDYVKETISDIKFNCLVSLAPGGATRSESVRNGLMVVSKNAENKDVVLIHDATHPYVDKEGILAVIEAVHEYGGATLGAFQYDTCYQMDSEQHLIQRVIPRQELVSGASPEAFHFGDISSIYFTSTDEELSRMTCAGALALAHGIPMKVVSAKVLNLKLTYLEDLKLYRLLKNTYFFNDSREV